MTSIPAGDVNLDLRIDHWHFVELALQLPMQAGNNTVPGVGWNCCGLETEPVRMRHVLLAMWMEQWGKFANNVPPDTESMMGALNEITAGALIDAILESALGDAATGNTIIDGEAHTSTMTWRRHLARVVDLRTRDMWPCTLDVDATLEHKDLMPYGNPTRAEVSTACGTWPEISPGQLFPGPPKEADQFLPFREPPDPTDLPALRRRRIRPPSPRPADMPHDNRRRRIDDNRLNPNWVTPRLEARQPAQRLQLGRYQRAPHHEDEGPTYHDADGNHERRVFRYQRAPPRRYDDEGPTYHDADGNHSATSSHS
jgi:hypothetical protein